MRIRGGFRREASLIGVSSEGEPPVLIALTTAHRGGLESPPSRRLSGRAEVGVHPQVTLVPGA